MDRMDGWIHEGLYGYGRDCKISTLLFIVIIFLN